MNAATWRWLIMFAVCAASVALCMAFVDRPVAEFVQTHLRQTAFFAWTSRIIGLLSGALILMLFALVVAGLSAISGRPVAPRAALFVSVALGGVWALSAAVLVKVLVGRSSPDPQYVVHRLYEYHPLHGTPGFEAFPSATTAVTMAAAAVLWIRMPRSRALSVGIATIVAVALVLMNGHWVSDVIGGAFLGATIGWMTAMMKERA